MSWQEDVLTRLASLMVYGGDNIEFGTTQGYAHFFGWRTQVISALQAMLGKNNIYTKEFISRVLLTIEPQPI